MMRKSSNPKIKKQAKSLNPVMGWKLLKSTNQALHLTAIPLRSVAAGERGR
jgi:hypothetical protein